MGKMYPWAAIKLPRWMASAGGMKESRRMKLPSLCCFALHALGNFFLFFFVSRLTRIFNGEVFHQPLNNVRPCDSEKDAG